jgi:molybdopterin-guanine dinucleotide biosynthesis protein A
MGGADKALARIGDRRLIDVAVERAGPQVARLIISSGAGAQRFDAFDLPVVPDDAHVSFGPLAGIVAAMDWFARHAPECAYLASFAVDTPFFPLDLVQALVTARGANAGATAAASSGGRLHPVFTLWPLAAEPQLRAALRRSEVPRLRDVVLSLRPAIAEIRTAPFDPFFNVNTPEDLKQARELAQTELAVGQRSCRPNASGC